MRLDFSDIAELALLTLARAALGLFLSGALGLLAYIMFLPVALSVWEVERVNFALMGVLTIGIGGGAGAFLGWFNGGMSRRAFAISLALTISAALAGAWVGLYESRDIFKLVGRPGIPALTGIVVGTILSANALRLCLWTVAIVRKPRL